MAKKKNTDRFKEIRNAKAGRDYFIDESYEAGIVLTGTEVKSIREGRAQLSDAFVRFNNKGRPILYHCHISEYVFGNMHNHNPVRPRELLLNKKEIIKLSVALQSGGRTIIPLRIYFKKALIKVEIGLCRGKKNYDKREDLRSKTEKRELDQLRKQYNVK